DTGVIQAITQAPQSISYGAMAERQQALTAEILKDPNVESLTSFIGVDGSNITLNSGRMLINLKARDHRSESSAQIIRDLQQRVTRLQKEPSLADVATDLQSNGQSVYIEIDRASAARFGITPATVDNALYDAFGQRIVSTIFTQSNQYRVILESEPKEQHYAE